MSTDPIQIDGPKFPPTETLDLSPQGTTLPQLNDVPSSQRTPNDQVLLSGSDPRYATLLDKKGASNGVATLFRRSDQALHALGQKIGELKAPLEVIRKTFPPYAPEDQARVKLLRQYASIRKEIDALTVPPPPDPGKNAHATPVLPPALPPQVSDRQINDHLWQLDAAGAAVDGVRQALAATATALAGEAAFFGARSPEKPVSAGTYREALSEDAAREKSAEIGQQIARMQGQGIGLAPSQFLKALG